MRASLQCANTGRRYLKARRAADYLVYLCSEQHFTTVKQSETISMTTNWWTGKQNVAGILCSHDELSTETFYSMAKLWKHCVKGKWSQIQKATYYMIWFTWNVQKRQIHRDSRWVVARGWEDKRGWKAAEVSLRWWKCSRIDAVCECHQPI